MQMRTTPYGNIRRRFPATANTMSAVPLFSTNFIRQDVSDIMCDFVLANETPATRPSDEREAPGDEATWDEGGGGGGGTSLKLARARLNYCDKIIIRIPCDLNCFLHIH